LLSREVSILTEDIAVLSQLLFSDFRNHLFDKQLHVFISAVFILRREGVCPQEGRHDLYLLRVLLLQEINYLQEFDLSVEVQPIAGLHL